MRKAGRILVVSDHPATAAALSGRGFEVTAVPAADDGYALLMTASFDLLVIDLEDPIETAGLIKWMRARGDLKRVLILIIAEWGTGGATMALAQGADAFEAAPIDSHRLLAAAERLLPRTVMTAKAGGSNGSAQD